MPLSFGVLVGLLTIVVGTVLYKGMRQKRAAMVVIGIGAAMVLLVLAALVLAANSNM